jgi:hypothetical protein
METTKSADGTVIAYDVWGSGPTAVVVGGAFNDRGTWSELAQALAAEGLTGVTYDRRGRGDSTDASEATAGTVSADLDVQREVEDVLAVIEAVDAEGPVYGHGVSSGGALLLQAAGSGAPLASVSVIEPPYRGEGAPPAPESYIATLRGFLEADDREGLVTYFQTQVVGLPAELLEPMKGTPMWQSLLAMAPTLVYDGQALGGDDHSLPHDLLARLGIPVLAVASEGTPIPWLVAGAEQVAGAVPDGRFVRLPGGFHEVPVPVLAPVLAKFYRAGR